MTETSRHDAWQGGDSYEAYMGRWSRQIAPRFVDWLGARKGMEWLEVGCGTGALSAAILEQAQPSSLISIDSSEDFVKKAWANFPDRRAEFRVGDAQALNLEAASRDLAVAALMLNFVPDRKRMLAEMKRVTRPSGTVGLYVWDYPNGGLEFVQAFWKAAIALDPAAQEFDEQKRFSYCTPAGLTELAESVGLASVESTSIELPTVFHDFDDYWRPFTLGAGPAPGYCVKLDPVARQRLKEKLERDLPRQKGGSIHFKMRAWAIKAIVA